MGPRARVLCLGAIFAVHAFAHHSFAVQYDASRLITLRGTVARLDWSHPHVHLFVDIPNGSGPAVTWDLELGSPNGLRSSGFTRNSLKTGEEVIVQAFPAKDHSTTGNASKIDTADGRHVLTTDSSGRYPTLR